MVVLVALFSLTALAAATPLYTPSADVVMERRTPLALAPLVTTSHPHGTIEDSYIVMLKPDVHPTIMTKHLNALAVAHSADPAPGLQSGIKQVYDGHVKGYAGTFTQNVVNRIREMPEVDYVEKDQIVKTLDLGTEKGAPWGLARISHRAKLTFGTFTKYEYDTSGGDGVDVYVIDTGINIKHAEFEGRASWGKTIPKNDVDEDGNGHGTHCAGTIASAKYGVAKKANVIAVKVLGSNGSGSMSDVVSGVVWAFQQASAKAAAADEEFAKTGNSTHKGSVANMSLGGGKSQALDDTVNKAVDQGLHFAVAAGNDNKDACNYSPAAAGKAVTVGASTLGDERAYFSNYGKCVDVFGPGLSILSTWIGSDRATNTISGTSMASPHVAGLLAYLLSLYPSTTFDPSVESNELPALFSTSQSTTQSAIGVYALVVKVLPNWLVGYLPPAAALVDSSPSVRKTLTPKELKTALLSLATEDALTGSLPSGTPNLLIFNNATKY